MSHPSVLIAGIGNIFLGDDGFGVEVARRLSSRPFPDSARVIDFGIRGLDLAYTLLDSFSAVLLVDAVQRGGAPGTLYLIEPTEELDRTAVSLDTHGMHPQRVLEMVRALGGRTDHVRVVGCEPATFGSDEEPMMGLSKAIEAAVEPAIRMIEDLIQEVLKPHIAASRSLK